MSKRKTIFVSFSQTSGGQGGGEGSTLEISGWGCATGTLEPLAYTRTSLAEFCYPTLD